MHKERSNAFIRSFKGALDNSEEKFNELSQKQQLLILKI